ncbi:MAG TPA: hypothetical protein PLB49_04725 [Chitinophagaceae bacterium]|nr:hypothetical protein [Chitinophagaceae bacterium]
MKRSERNITVILFFLVLLVFSLAQEQSRVMERMYTGKWNLQAGQQPAPSLQHNPIAGPVKSE